jgi:transcriptional regulator with XRE-family HTH domain
MDITTSEKIRILLRRRNMTLSALAEKTGQSRQNLSNKMARDNFSQAELKTIAEALNCQYRSTFYLKDTGEEI